MPTEPETPTLFQVVHRAVEVCDPAGGNESLAQWLERFQDRNEPVTAIGDVEQELAEEKGALDPQDEDPALVMAAAVATYLAFRRPELSSEREELLRRATRAEFDDSPPPQVEGWLAEQGLSG